MPHALEFKRHAQCARWQVLLSRTPHMLLIQEFRGSVAKYVQSIFLYTCNLLCMEKKKRKKKKADFLAHGIRTQRSMALEHVLLISALK